MEANVTMLKWEDLVMDWIFGDGIVGTVKNDLLMSSWVGGTIC